MTSFRPPSDDPTRVVYLNAAPDAAGRVVIKDDDGNPLLRGFSIDVALDARGFRHMRIYVDSEGGVAASVIRIR